VRLASCAARDGWVDWTIPFLLSAGVAQAVERVLAVTLRNELCWFESVCVEQRCGEVVCERLASECRVNRRLVVCGVN